MRSAGGEEAAATPIRSAPDTSLGRLMNGRDGASASGIAPVYARPFGTSSTYLFRLGFLDGKEGFIFHFLQAFWYRLLVDINRDELTANKTRIQSWPSRRRKGLTTRPKEGIRDQYLHEHSRINAFHGDASVALFSTGSCRRHGRRAIQPVEHQAGFVVVCPAGAELWRRLRGDLDHQPAESLFSMATTAARPEERDAGVAMKRINARSSCRYGP